MVAVLILLQYSARFLLLNTALASTSTCISISLSSMSDSWPLLSIFMPNGVTMHSGTCILFKQPKRILKSSLNFSYTSKSQSEMFSDYFGIRKFEKYLKSLMYVYMYTYIYILYVFSPTHALRLLDFSGTDKGLIRCIPMAVCC